MKKIPISAQPLPTFDLLNKIVTELGTTKLSFWPFLNATGTTVFPYGSGSDGLLVTMGSAIESVFDPHRHVSGIYSVANDGTAAGNAISSADSANYSFGDSTIDSPFSVGAWILMQEAVGTARSILSKYGSTAAAKEWDFRFGTNGKLVLELLDESVVGDASEIATSTGTALTPFIWQFVVATYDGGEDAPVINLYINATSVHDGTSVETNAYVAMEDLAAVLMIGMRDAAGTPAQVFQGRIALPFVTGKELTAANISAIYYLGQRLLGLRA